MFGGPKVSVTPPAGSGRPQTSDIAKLTEHVTSVIAANEDLDGLNVFYDGQPIMTGSLENVGVEIVAPSDENPQGTLTGVLTYYETDKEGNRKIKSLPLFPGTLELIARGRRISIHCAEEGSFEGLYLRFGTKNDGVGLQAEGVTSLRIVITPGLVDARMIWAEDGREDNILPQAGERLLN
jgi:hypothetical protein